MNDNMDNGTDYQDHEIGQLLAELPTPDHGTGFWDQLAGEMEADQTKSDSALPRRPGHNPSRVLLIAAAVAMAALAIGALFAIGQVDRANETDAVNSSTTSTTQPTGTTTNSSPPTSAAPSPTPGPNTNSTVPQPAPPAISFLETIPTDRGGSVESIEPSALEGYEVVAMPGPGRRFVYFEPTGRIEEGCEAGPVSVNRLVLTDLDSNDRTVLAEELPLTDQSLDIGPNGELAIIGGCDANAWLAAIGQITSEGELTLERLPSSLEGGISGSNNFGVTTTWADDGQTFYFNSVRVAIEGGKVVAVHDDGTFGGSPIGEFYQLDAHLGGGSGVFLVSSRLPSGSRAYWILDEPPALNREPTDPPLFTDESATPSSARVEVAADGSRIVVTVDRSTPGAKTYIIGPTAEDIFGLQGEAVLAPDGTRALVSQRTDDLSDVADFTIVDLESGASTVGPEIETEGPPTQLFNGGLQMIWCCGGDDIFIQSNGFSFFFEPEVE